MKAQHSRKKRIAGGLEPPASKTELPEGFEGVWIPNFLYLHKGLSSADRETLGLIKGLSEADGGFVSVSYMAKIRGGKRANQSALITKLEKKGLVERLSRGAGKCNQVRLTEKALNPNEDHKKATEEDQELREVTRACPKNGTPPVPKTGHDNKYIEKDNNKSDNKVCAANAAPEYSGVPEGTTYRDKVKEFIQCWEIVARSGKWPVIIAGGPNDQLIEYFGHQIRNRLRLLLNKQEPKALVMELEKAVYLAADNNGVWILNTEKPFGIAWHLSALDKYRAFHQKTPGNKHIQRMIRQKREQLGVTTHEADI